MFQKYDGGHLHTIYDIRGISILYAFYNFKRKKEQIYSRTFKNGISISSIILFVHQSPCRPIIDAHLPPTLTKK